MMRLYLACTVDGLRTLVQDGVLPATDAFAVVRVLGTIGDPRGGRAAPRVVPRPASEESAQADSVHVEGVEDEDLEYEALLAAAAASAEMVGPGGLRVVVAADIPAQDVGVRSGPDVPLTSGHGSDPNNGTDPGFDPGNGTDPGFDPDHGTDPGSDPDHGTDPGSDPDHGTDPGTAPDTDTAPDSGTSTATGSGTWTGAGTEAGSGSDLDGRPAPTAAVTAVRLRRPVTRRQVAAVHVDENADGMAPDRDLLWYANQEIEDWLAAHER